MEEQQSHLLEILPGDTIRQVAVIRMEGHSVKEIAAHFDFKPRWAERRLELIRNKWTKELAET